MRLNFSIWTVARTFYSLSLFIAIPLLLIIWFVAVPEDQSSQSLTAAFSITIGYFLLGWYLLSYTPKKYYSDVMKKVSAIKQEQKFNPDFELISKYGNRYIGWNSTNNTLLFISENENYGHFGQYTDLVNISVEGEHLVFLTKFPNYPKAFIHLSKQQKNYALSTLAQYNRVAMFAK
ncbi:hypothetical protein L292_3174 [Acinetobacter junii CIP 107470 = MTCC 11364]|uniref:Uncharacterized protein n=1 Tax=Acinetobacter junii CIP 107470 = MTCC 11364 TaxID=1217666 RepID=S7Y3R1_ACIJU|nr:hypothetical protein [Acinetobacter junii]ENV52029.1 hypothetical protein F953_00519 [Acinetobacter junii CIP 107470 = MTCC 11364]EPR85844.1 hypothetical protein L292_3174 [Acinetobacter junii CIP 107470 = MTCC 11364]